MKKLISFLLVILLMPIMSFAQEQEAPLITSVVEGQPAPFSGTLLNDSAAAQIYAQQEFQDEECELKVEYEVGRTDARYQYLLESSRITLESLQERYNFITEIQQGEIHRLQDSIIDSSDTNSNIWWALGGVTVGATIGAIIVFLVN